MNDIESITESQEVYVAVFVCEKVIQDKRGVYSAINIFDKFEVDVPEGVDVPESMNTPTVFCMTIFRPLASSLPIGFTVKWRITSPNGKSVESLPQPVKLLADTSGHTSVFPIVLSAALVGRHLVEVLINDRPAAFTPLKIAHNPIPSSSLGGDVDPHQDGPPAKET